MTATVLPGKNFPSSDFIIVKPLIMKVEVLQLIYHIPEPAALRTILFIIGIFIFLSRESAKAEICLPN